MTTRTATKYLSLQQVAGRFPSSRSTPDGDEIPTHPATVSRWVKTGVKVAGGSRVRLQAIRSPSGWKVSEEAVEAFLAHLTALALGDDAETHDDTPQAAVSAARARELARVDRELDAAGI